MAENAMILAMERGRGRTGRRGRSLASKTPTVSSRMLLSLASVWVAGCFPDKINTAPVARIEVVGGATQYFYGTPVTLSADSSSDADGDSDIVEMSWEQHACP